MSSSIPSRLQWRIRQLTRKLWFRATLFSLLAVATALVGIALKPLIPDSISRGVGADAVDNILGVIASSMLAVTIFSLSTMVNAYVAASSNVTPRSIRLLTDDATAQNALGTFIGAFLFSLVGIIALSTGVYGAQGRLVLFVVTLAVVAFVVFTLLRWIDHVSKLGQVAGTTHRIEEAAIRAMRARHDNPYLGGHPLRSMADIPDDAQPIYPREVGYVQNIDMEALSELAQEHNGCSIYIGSPPGTLAEPSRPLTWIRSGPGGKQCEQEVRKAFSIGRLRSYDQDPRFGASVLAEIASHALSSGINDPGTAIDIIGRAVRLLSVWAERKEPAPGDDVPHPRVYVPGILLPDLFDDIFRPIARDGAGLVEIGIRLQKALRSLARIGDERFAECAQHHSRQALQRALEVLTLEEDKRQLRELADEVARVPASPSARARHAAANA
ncbi:MAG: DUF2254 domain-containing protein [Pseudomonadota bacterium]|nr:DUF2254 domain-containing protein [Pseudomonadota bacterium]